MKINSSSHNFTKTTSSYLKANLYRSHSTAVCLKGAVKTPMIYGIKFNANIIFQKSQKKKISKRNLHERDSDVDFSRALFELLNLNNEQVSKREVKPGQNIK